MKGRWKGTTFHELRTRLYNEGKLNFLESDFDTLYILENYEVETGTYISRIWNKRGGVSYVYNRNSFSSDREKLFTDYTVQLVQAWDTATIKREASINASTLPERYINATRLSLANAQTKIECITFKEFFELERDR
ncbi:hypothetical protein [Anaerocolumna jejuensis]|uniref:hypothetical protein n=1 Tax=Anaerocolumna jejuensis TaxID=259063 RepID=UPI003F7C4DE0